MFQFHWIAIVLYVLSGVVKSDRVCDGARNSCEVPVKTDAGWVCGRLRLAEHSTQYASFRGIPYGKPPTGERRFKELEPIEPWEGYLDATEDSPACPQKDILYGSITLQQKGMSEDCIYLNIHVPYKHLPLKGTAGAGLPILVMIHGGGFNVGSGLTDCHGPEYLMTKEVLVITFNYRINVFGFLSLNSSVVPGNQGLRDQVTLLQWVQRNARAFGGNPDDVTLMGQSAGATCAHLLTLSNATKGLFKRVILMSGSAIPNYYTTSPEFAKDTATTFLSLLGINSTDSSVIHQQLVQMPLTNIMQANTVLQKMMGLTTFVPTMENKYPGVTTIIDSPPLELMAAGRGRNIPFLIGFTDQEFEFFRWISMNLDLLQGVKNNPALLLSPRLRYNLPEDELTNITQRVYDKCFNGTETLDKLLHYLSYSFFKYPAFKLAEIRAKYALVYLYKYSYKSEESLIKRALWLVYDGAAHVEDLTYVFRVNSMLGDHVSFPAKNNDDEMKNWMVTRVTNFMRCSNPTCSEDDDWSQYSNDPAQYKRIADPYVNNMADFTAEELDMVQFIDSIDAEIRNLKY